MSGCKYYKQIKQVSYDNKQTWENVVPAEYRKGELYEEHSEDCANFSRWKLVPGGYICENNSKYEKKVLEVSEDGVNYKIKYPAEYSKGDLIESNSIECTYKWYGNYNIGSDVAPTPYNLDPIKITLCYGNDDRLSNNDVSYSGYTLISGYVGTCVNTLVATFQNRSNMTTLNMSNSNITEIPDFEFTGCTSLSNIYLPPNLKSVGDSAFSGCTSLPVEDNIRYADTCAVAAVDKTLTTCTIKNGTKFIGSEAFISCNSLTSIDIPDSVLEINRAAFYGCSGLTNITIGSGVTKIGVVAFEGCTSLPVENGIRYADTYLVSPIDKTLTTCTIKNGTKFIGDFAFYNCSDLTTCTIGSGLTSIGKSAFEGCSGLTSIDIQDSVTSIGESAFNGCTDLTSINIPSGITAINYASFSRCESLTSIDIPDSVTSIGDYAFNSCTAMTTCTIGSGVTSIGSGTFSRCYGLTSIDIPDNITSIGEYAFKECGLTNCTIGSGVTSIGKYAFQSCNGLRSVTIYAITPPSLGISPFYDNANNRKFYVPAESVETYQSASGWSEYASYIQPIPTS